MRQSHAGIIKRNRIDDRTVEDAETVLRRPVRVKRDQVLLAAPDRDESAPGTQRRTNDARVFPTDAVRMSDRTFELEVPEFVADFPVDDAHRDEDGADAQAASDGSEDGADDEEHIDVEALRAAWEAEWQERTETAVAEARQQGLEEGAAQAKEKLAGELDAFKQTYADDIECLGQLWHDHVEASKPLLTELTVDVAEMLLDAPLPKTVKSASARAIAETIEELAGASSIVVRLHPVDYQRLQESGIADQLDSVHSELRWDPNPDVVEGDWIVESPSAVIRRVRDELVETLRRRLGLLSLGEQYKKSS